MKKQENPIVNIVTDKVERALTKYSNSKATTNAGAVLRFIARFIPIETIIQLAAHKVAPQQ